MTPQRCVVKPAVFRPSKFLFIFPVDAVTELVHLLSLSKHNREVQVGFQDTINDVAVRDCFVDLSRPLAVTRDILGGLDRIAEHPAATLPQQGGDHVDISQIITESPGFFLQTEPKTLGRRRIVISVDNRRALIDQLREQIRAMEGRS